MYNNFSTYPNMNMYTGINSQLRQEIVRVNGRNGANAYQLPPNSSILLLDETAPIVWLKTTDGASYPTITGYKIMPIETQPTVESQSAYDKLEERISRLEDIINGKSDTSDVKQIKTIGKASN